MAGISTIPCPREILEKLEQAPEPAEPTLDLATLETYHADWVYPKSLDYWEGFVYADLCEQLGWAHLRHEEYQEALEAWRECPWASAEEGERQALAQLLQSAYENQKLILGPPVADLLSHGRVPLGAILATLDDPAATLRRASSGHGYVTEARIVQPGGLYNLRFEFSTDTLFYVSFLPAEVHSKVLLSRTHYQMGEADQAAKWLLRAAFVAHAAGLGPEACSFLEKAQQLDPQNEAIGKSLRGLQAKGVTPALFSRVVVERSLFQPDPVMRCEVRPEPLPSPESPWLDVNWLSKLSPSQFRGQVDGKVATLGTLPMEEARRLVERLGDSVDAWPLLLPPSWTLPEKLDLAETERRLSTVRGMGLEKLGLWKGNYRAVLAEMLETWPSSKGRAAEPEVIEFALPKEAQVCLFSCTESWLIPILLDLELPELKSVESLSAWLRRLMREWDARPLLVTDDVIWFQLEELPEEERRELFLADLMSFSSDVGECFEPAMIRSLSPGGPYLFPVPLQLQFTE